MKVQILVDGRVVNTQLVSELLNESLSVREAKRLALKAALEDNALKPSEALRVEFRVFDVMGNPTDD